MVATLVKQYSFEEYCQHDDGTDTRYELDNGILIEMTPPKGLHFLVAQRLEKYLTEAIQQQQEKWICLKDAGLRTNFSKSRLPDLMVVEEEKFMDLLDKSLIFDEPPLLAIEIVSPESVARDYRYKRSEYAAIAIPEYWVIDPSEGKVTTFIFNEGLYDEIIFTGEQNIVSLQFPDLKISPQAILTV